MTISARLDGETPWERAQHDRAFLRRFTERYSGAYDVMDALWWIDHPDQSGPSGAPAPSSVLQEVRTALFREGADVSMVDGYRERLRADADERMLVERAVASAGAGWSAGVDRSTGPARRWGIRVIAVAGCLAVGTCVGLLWGARTDLGGPRPSAVRSTGVAATVGPPLEPAYPTLPAPGLTVFSGRQTSADVPVVPLGPQFDPSTFRLLSAGAEGVRLYAARSTSGRGVCLVAVSADRGSAVTCEAVADFAHRALNVTLVLPTRLASGGGTQTPSVMATWSTDGVDVQPDPR